MLPDKRSEKVHLNSKPLLMVDFIRVYLQDMRYESASSTRTVLKFSGIVSSNEKGGAKAENQAKKMPVSVELQVSVTAQLQFLIDVVGVNVSQLSDLLKVGRPSIYKWLQGADIRRANFSRLEALHSIFQSWNNQFGVTLGQYLYKKIDGQLSLYDLLIIDEIDIARAKEFAVKLNHILLEAYDRAELRRRKLENAGFAPASKEQKNKALDDLIRKA